MGAALGLTEENVKKVCVFLERGSSYKNAYLQAGINPRTGHNYRFKGRKDVKEKKDTDYAAYYRRTEEARAYYFQSMTDKVTEQAKYDGLLAIKVLQSRLPSEWNPAHSHISLEEFDIDSSSNERFKAVWKELSQGTISIEQSLKLGELIEKEAKVEEMTELKHRLENLENKLGEL